MLGTYKNMINWIIVHSMAAWETAGAKEDQRRPTRSRRRRAHVGHGVRIVVQDGCRARAAAALHQLQRVLPELHQLLACDGRERLHRGHERRELLPDGVVRGLHAIVPEQRLDLRLLRAGGTGRKRLLNFLSS